MRYTTGNTTFGFIKLGPGTAEAAFSSNYPSINTLLRVENEIWRVRGLTPSLYVAGVMICQLQIEP